MPDVIVAPKIITTRKDHQCLGCMDKIPKGSKADVQVNAADGEIYRVYLCLPCAEHWDEAFRDDYVDGDGLSLGQLIDICHDYYNRDCETCQKERFSERNGRCS